MKIATLPPYALAMLASRVHGICQLCGQMATKTKDCEYLSGGAVAKLLNHTPLLCQHCHKAWTSQLPTFIISTDTKPILLYVSAYYDTPLSHIMSAFKDKGNISALMVLYHLLRFIKLPSHLTHANSVLIPTPTTPSRLVERGFYPVLTIAKYLSFLWQIPLWQGIHRLDNTTHQRGLSRTDRLENVKGDFYLTDTPPTRHLILIDDVITTGSTLTAMANAIWADFPQTHIHAVGVLHGRADIHLPTSNQH